MIPRLILLSALAVAAAWASAQDIDLGLRFNDGTGMVKPAGCAKEESKLRVQTKSGTYGIRLVPPNDPNATKMRIALATGEIKAVKKYVACTPRTIGNGNPHALGSAVNARIRANRLPYTNSSNLALLRSVNASGGGRQWTSDGTIQATALTEICQIMGFTSYVKSTCLDNERSGLYPNGKCYYHSPEDNKIQVLNAATNNFTSRAAGEKYKNTWVATLTCGCN